jgi:YfiH family protein
METLIYPEIFSSHVTAFFTGKVPGVDIKEISNISSVSRQEIYLPIQKHTDKVVWLNSDMSPRIADAVITNNRGILLGIQVADCVPILLYDMKKSVIGAVHAGWRGTASEILKKTVIAICERFKSVPENMVMAIGPSIRGCCYGVGYEVIEAIEKVTSSELRVKSSKDYIIKKGEKYCLDLPTANKYQAISSGVKPGNIWMSDECTFCLPEKYYSYRYAKGHTGRQGGFIGII